MLNMVEVNMNVLCAPQGYYLAQAISRDMNFKIGLPAQFDKAFNVEKRIRALNDFDLEIGKAYVIGNLFSLVVKDSSYDAPDNEALFDALTDMRDQMERECVTKLAIPKICCGRMGLDWEEVKELIEFVFSDSDVNIIVCCQ